ncbi:MAG: hypothetical protein AAGG46_09190, partial [Planctomycetota bacterium]
MLRVARVGLIGFAVGFAVEFVGAASPAEPPRVGADQSPRDRSYDQTRRRVAELIEQLGAPKYTARRAAELELTEIGLPAFDQVLAATRSPDPEVAAASTYLLGELSIEWSSPNDPPLVSRLLEDFGEMDEPERLSTVDAISQRVALSGAAEALCRIVRFDPSPIVSRRAAAAVIACETLPVPEDRTGELRRSITRLDERYGPSSRVANGWVERFAAQPDTPPADALSAWRGIVDAEAQQPAEAPGGASTTRDTRSAIALDWNLLRLQLAAGGEDDAVTTVNRLVDATGRELGDEQGDAALARV